MTFLGREFKIELVEGIRVWRDITDEERFSGSTISGSSNDVTTSADYWYVVATKGKEKLFGYVRTDDEKVVFLCIALTGDSRRE